MWFKMNEVKESVVEVHTEYICPKCYSTLSACDKCDDYFEPDEKIWCLDDGEKHYCNNCKEEVVKND